MPALKVQATTTVAALVFGGGPVSEELFPQLRTLQDVWEYVWRGYAVTIDARRRVMLGVRYEPRLPLAIAEPGPLMTHVVCLAGPAGITLQVQLRSGGRVVVTTELRPNRAGDVQPQVVLRCR